MSIKQFTLSIFIVFLVVIVITIPSQVDARSTKQISTIRDDEIERYIRKISNPLFVAAGLEPRNINIYIINNPDINAYVSGGQNMFINTGLIIQSEDPSMLAGVIAHETGHISGGHLIRLAEDASNAFSEMVIGTIMGAASAVAGVPPEAAAAIMAGSKQYAERGFLKNTRAHEEAADQIALRLLKEVKISPNGLNRLLKKINAKQANLLDGVSPYRLTHPLTRERMSYLRNYISTYPELDFSISEELQQQHNRISAKIRAFLLPVNDKIETVKYTTINDRYVNAIELYRIPNVDKAIEAIDGLIKDMPKDPYFHELKGQVLFENGFIVKAIDSYQKASDLLPDSSLIRFELGLAQLSSTIDEFLPASIENFEQVVVKEPRNSMAKYQLAIAYGKNGQLGMSYLLLAERDFLLSKKEDLKVHIALAKKHLPKNSPSFFKLDELKNMAEHHR